MLEIRILEVFKQSQLSRAEFAQALGISNAVLSHISSGRNKPSLDLVLSLLDKFKDINPEWLLLGNGPMLRKDLESSWLDQQKTMKVKVLEVKEHANKMLYGIQALETLLNEEH